MKRYGSPYRLPPRWRWITGPVLAFSGGGAAVAVWLEENGIPVAKCVPAAALFALSALLYGFNHFVFKAAMPRREDLKSERETPPGGR